MNKKIYNKFYKMELDLAEYKEMYNFPILYFNNLQIIEFA